MKPLYQKFNPLSIGSPHIIFEIFPNPNFDTPFKNDSTPSDGRVIDTTLKVESFAGRLFRNFSSFSVFRESSDPQNRSW